MYVSTILFINISIASHHRPLLPFPSLPSETIVLIYDSICFLCVIVGWLGTLPLCSMWLCAGEDCPVLPHWRKRTWRKSKEKRECILRFSASKLYLLFFFFAPHKHTFEMGKSQIPNWHVFVAERCVGCLFIVLQAHTHRVVESDLTWLECVKFAQCLRSEPAATCSGPALGVFFSIWWSRTALFVHVKNCGKRWYLAPNDSALLLTTLMAKTTKATTPEHDAIAVLLCRLTGADTWKKKKAVS